MEKKNTSKRLGALDIFIIIAIIAAIVCIGIRYLAMNKSEVAEKVELDEYNLSFSVLNIRASTAENYMDPDTVFYQKENGSYFGKLCEGLTINDAETFYETEDGTIVIGKNNAVGDLYRVDVDGNFIVKGKMDGNGSFLLNGNQYLAVNKTVLLASKYVTFTVVVTGISPVQN